MPPKKKVIKEKTPKCTFYLKNKGTCLLCYFSTLKPSHNIFLLTRGS